MSYDLDQMVAKFREQMDDVATPYLWSDDEIIDYLDEAEDEFADLVDAIPDTLEIPHTGGDATVEMPSYITRVRGAYDEEGRDIQLFNDEEWNDALYTSDYGWTARKTQWRMDTGKVTSLITDTVKDEARLYPIPETSGTLYLRVYRRPLLSLADRGAFEITDRAHQRCLLLKTRSLGYMKHDSDVYDPKKAESLDAQFRMEASKFAARITRSRRRARLVEYGGY